MQVESGQAQDPSPSRRHRGPQGLGECVASVLGERPKAGESVGGVEEEEFLKRWFADNGGFLSEGGWDALEPVTNHTAEHEVRFRADDERAVKRTWAGTFGNVPREICGQWVAAPATPSELEVFTLLRDQGFDPIIGSLFGWRHLDDGIIVPDAKPDNFISTADGIPPIDLLLAQLVQFK